MYFLLRYYKKETQKVFQNVLFAKGVLEFVVKILEN